MMASPSSSRDGGSRRLMRMGGNPGGIPFGIDIVPPSLVDEIAPFLRVANEVQMLNPRIAYLCRFHTFEKAHQLDPTSRGLGVRQFKTALLQRLEKENDPTLKGRAKKSDVQEMQIFYQHYAKNYIQALQNSTAEVDRAQLTKACQTANVLFEVLEVVNLTQSREVDRENLDAHNKESKTAEIYAPHNEVAEIAEV